MIIGLRLLRGPADPAPRGGSLAISLTSLYNTYICMHIYIYIY